MSDAQWYVVDEDGDEQGPLTGEDLKARARRGRIVAETRIRRADLRMAVPARDIAGLLPDDAPAASPAPTPAVAPTPGAPTAGRHVIDATDEPPAAPRDVRAPRVTSALAGALFAMLALLCTASGLVVAETPAGEAITATTGDASALVDVALIAVVAAALLTPLLFMAWMYRAYRVVGELGDRRRHGSLAPLWSWFVPVLNLVIPVRILNDIRASAGVPSGLLVGSWWLVGFAVSLASALVAPASPSDGGVPLILAASYCALSAVLVLDTTKAQAVRIGRQGADAARRA